jgi:cytochrome oxidase Cu insertion factor (SCO1/SenC/PrrC family)
MHSNRVVLVDTEGRIRAYYDGLAVEAEQIVRDVRSLLR